MNTKMMLPAAALGLICAWTAQADECVEPAPMMLSFNLEVHEGMTKTAFRLKERGSLKFTNKSEDKPLQVRSDAKAPPFEVPGVSTPQSGFTVPPGSTLSVTIAAAYEVGSRFTFSSQIEGSKAEDPIVIIERR